MYTFCYWFLLYFMYCVLGYILECTFCSIIDKKIVLNRGFLIGPYLPIYGKGAICIILLLNKYLKDPIVLFVMAALIATILEYFASYFMEKIFKARWWDYSNHKLNLNGRVCFTNTVLFGIGGVVIMYLINPAFTSLLGLLGKTATIVFGIIFFVIYETDSVISIVTTYKLRKTSMTMKKDMSSEIKAEVRESVLKNSYFKKRLLNAFPKLKNNSLFDQIKDILNKK